MGELILGIDFRAGKERVPVCNAPDVALISSEPLGKEFEDVLFGNLWGLYLVPDPAPSELNPDSGDCA